MHFVTISLVARLSAVALLSLALFACSAAPKSPERSPFGVSTPEDQGVESARLHALVSSIGNGNLGVHSLLIVRHGQIVLDAYFFPYDGVRPHDVASVTKALTSTAAGIAGVDLSRTLPSFFPDRAIAHLTAEKSALTLEHALSMTSGLDCRADPIELGLLQESKDWVGFALDLPMAAPPGTEFRYCSAVTHAVSGAITAATGEPIDALLNRELFDRIGSPRALWPRDPQGVARGWGDARLWPEALARFGQLLLDGGTFDGKRVLDARFIDRATENQVGEIGPACGYGYAFWLLGGGAFSADGRGGQFVFVVPEIDTVVVVTGAAEPPQTAALVELLKTELEHGFSDFRLTPDPDAQAELSALIEAVAAPPEPHLVPSPPALTREISGRQHVLEPNPLGWERVALEFGESTAKLRVTFDGENVSADVGLDEVPRVTRGVRFAAPTRYADVDVALVGGWIGDGEFEIRFDTIDTIDAGTLGFVFDERTVRISLFEKTFVRSELTFTGTRDN